MKKEELELIIMLKVSESLGITVEEVKNSIVSKNEHSLSVLKQLGIEKSKHEKLMEDYYNMTKGLHNAVPVMVEYSKEKDHDQEEGNKDISNPLVNRMATIADILFIFTSIRVEHLLNLRCNCLTLRHNHLSRASHALCRRYILQICLICSVSKLLIEEKVWYNHTFKTGSNHY